MPGVEEEAREEQAVARAVRAAREEMGQTALLFRLLTERRTLAAAAAGEQQAIRVVEVAAAAWSSSE